MRLLPTRVSAELVPLPGDGESRLSGDPGIDREVHVLVGLRLSFTFRRREDGDWQLLGAWTGARGFPLDEAWVAAARELACRAFRAAIGDGADMLTCPECGRILCSPELARAEKLGYHKLPAEDSPRALQRKGVRCLAGCHDVLYLDLLDGRGGALGYHKVLRFGPEGLASWISGRWSVEGDEGMNPVR